MFDLKSRLKVARKSFRVIDDDIQLYTDYINKKSTMVSHAEMSDHDAWLFDRQLGIGGSDVASVLGVSKFSTRYELWENKVFGKPSSIDPKYAKWGNKLESVIADNFSEVFGFDIVKSPPASHNNKRPWLRYNIDADIPRSFAMLEVKTSSAEMVKNWGAGIDPTSTLECAVSDINEIEFPIDYFCQCQYYMKRMNKFYCYLAVLIGGNEERFYLIKANADFQELVDIELTKFYIDNVVKNSKPNLTEFEMIDKFKAFDASGVAYVDEDIKYNIDFLKTIKDKQKQMAVDRRDVENSLVMAIGEKAKALDEAGNSVFTYNAYERVSVDKEALADLYPDIFNEVSTKKITRRLYLS